MSVAAPGVPPRTIGGGGIPAILLSATCYGLISPVVVLASRQGVTGTELVALRVIFLLAVVAAACALLRLPMKLERKDWGPLAGLGLTSAMIGPTYLTSVAYIPVGVAVVVFYTYPLLILAASPFVDGTRPNRYGLIAFGLAFIGIVLAVGTSFGDLDWRGLALAAVSSVIAATQFFFAARSPGGGGLKTIFWTQVIVVPLACLLAYMLAAPGAGERLAAAWPHVAGVSLLYMGAFGLYMRGMRTVAAATAGLIYCLEPVVSIVAAAIVLDERLVAAQYIGAALVLSGIALNMTLGKRRSLPPSESA